MKIPSRDTFTDKEAESAVARSGLVPLQVLGETWSDGGSIKFVNLVERVAWPKSDVAECVDEMARADWMQVRGGVVTLEQWTRDAADGVFGRDGVGDWEAPVSDT